MRRSIVRDQDGVSTWVWIVGGGVLLLLLSGIFFFIQPSNTNNEVEPEVELSDGDGDGDLDAFIEVPLPAVTADADRFGGFGQRHSDGFGDIGPLDVPAVGNFEFVTPAFEPLGQISPDALTHIIVAGNGSPPMASFLTIDVEVFDPVSGGRIWKDMIVGPADQVCRDDTGCSLDGPTLAELLALFPEGRYLFQASSDGQLLAEAAWIPLGDGSVNYGIDAELRQLEQDSISGRVTVQGGP